MVCEKIGQSGENGKKSIVLAHSKPQSGENGRIFIDLAHFKQKSGENDKKITVLAQLTEFLDFSRVKFEGFFLLLVKIN